MPLPGRVISNPRGTWWRHLQVPGLARAIGNVKLMRDGNQLAKHRLDTSTVGLIPCRITERPGPTMF
jgi:hypothetical protein